jgi:3-oxoacyl-[acyl-carrier-protein] synthase II
MVGMKPRVVITGIGIVSPLGTGATAFWSSLIAGVSGAERIAVEGLGTVTAYPVIGVDEAARDLFGHRETRRMDRVGRLAAVAGAMALEDAGTHGVDADRIGASIGCIHGGAQTLYDAHATLLKRGADRVSPLTIPLGLTNSAVAAAARVLEVRGPTSVTGTACAAGSDAIGTGIGLIRDGRADIVIAGGAEAPLSPLVVAGYRQLGALSVTDRPASEASRPFDLERDGFVMAEGAGVVVLEDRAHALARGARIYAEVVGFASTCDAGHLTDPDPAGEGAAKAIRLALADADIPAGAVGYVNAHATSTPAGDRAEAQALHSAGLDHAAVSSTKSAHGHALGAAGGIEAIVTALSLANHTLPATLNLITPDPEVPLDHIRTPRAATIEIAISNSFGFGGHNACVVMRAHHPTS